MEPEGMSEESGGTFIINGDFKPKFDQFHTCHRIKIKSINFTILLFLTYLGAPVIALSIRDWDL